MDSKKQKRSRRKYDAAFKQEVVKMTRAGRSVPDIALSLGVGENIMKCYGCCYKLAHW
ncbi:MAG TPA: transposase [Flavisolibacter sp.]|nr:transposase [Flavisolibacter sp.]